MQGVTQGSVAQAPGSPPGLTLGAHHSSRASAGGEGPIARLLSSDTFALNASLWDHGMLISAHQLCARCCLFLCTRKCAHMRSTCVTALHGHPSRLHACIPTPPRDLYVETCVF
jgi:hypothetical protein